MKLVTFVLLFCVVVSVNIRPFKYSKQILNLNLLQIACAQHVLGAITSRNVNVEEEQPIRRFDAMQIVKSMKSMMKSIEARAGPFVGPNDIVGKIFFGILITLASPFLLFDIFFGNGLFN